MLKITQLLKESLTTYKLNFKKIFWIALPILVLGIIGEYSIEVFNTMIDKEDFANISYLFASITIWILTILIVALYFSPVLKRAIQKKEDGEQFNTNLAYSFQKKNIFKWIMVNVWGMLYMLWIMLPYILVSVLLTVILFMHIVLKTSIEYSPIIPNTSIGLDTYLDTYNNILILSSLIGLTILTGTVLNITKFMLYKNIFFSKDGIPARDAVRESIKLGKTKNVQVWSLIIALIILFIINIIIFFALINLSDLLIDKVSNNVLFYSEIIVNSALSSLIFLPLMSIIVAKGYVKIRE